MNHKDILEAREEVLKEVQSGSAYGKALVEEILVRVAAGEGRFRVADEILEREAAIKLSPGTAESDYWKEWEK